MGANFITGTGTDIGKTWLCCALLRHWRAAGLRPAALKPVLSGFDPDAPQASDAGQLLAALDQPLDERTLEAIAPWRYAAALSPDMAAAQERRQVPFDALVAFTRHQVRQVDSPHGGGAQDDRAVRARPGARGGRPQDRLLRHLQLRLRHPLLERIQGVHRHQLTIVDPKNFDPNSFVEIKNDYCIIPPNSFALARTVEYFRIPRNVLTVCLGKSTYARCGIIVNVTPFEPEWEGYVTLEFSNTTPLPAKIYANEGVAQVLFFESDEVCETSYKDRGGKYQGQVGVTLPKI
jgi:dCTP deaminase